MPKTLKIDLTPTAESQARYAALYAEAKVIDARAKEIYREKIRPRLTEADKGKYLIINNNTGEYVLHKDYYKVSEIAYERFGANPNGLFMRVGHSAVDSFRPGIDTELAKW